MAAKTKAVVDKQRLTFDRERWTSDAERFEAKQAVERKRLAFEKEKWETERIDTRAAMRKQQRYQVLSSLIEKGRTAEEAKAFLDLL
ncbi:hypothetical protein ON010_g14862 [Phytophthora cinnamomi]|nr:hypothetical protein ON010_g14862 [Phytophthora cinnamomi]